jgi:putative tricarboxylic transport membrane protein
MKVRTNLTGGIVFLSFGSILMLLLESQVITYGNIHFLQSAKVSPFMAEMVMIIGGILLIIQSLVFKKEKIVEIRWAEQKYAATVIGIFALFAALIYFIGFLVGSIVFIVLMSIFNKNRNVIQIIMLCLLAIGIYLLFTQVFYIQLPTFWRR